MAHRNLIIAHCNEISFSDKLAFHEVCRLLLDVSSFCKAKNIIFVNQIRNDNIGAPSFTTSIFILAFGRKASQLLEKQIIGQDL